MRMEYAVKVARETTQIRITTEAKRAADALAKDERVSRSAVMRALLSVGLAHPAEVVAKIRATREA